MCKTFMSCTIFVYCSLWKTHKPDIKFFAHLNKPKPVVNTGPDPFTGSDSQSDKEHCHKKYGDGKRNFVDSNISSHFKTIITNF